MHPSELKNCALVAANAAELSGFTYTAQALLAIAKACAEDVTATMLQDAVRPANWAAPATAN